MGMPLRQPRAGRVEMVRRARSCRCGAAQRRAVVYFSVAPPCMRTMPIGGLNAIAFCYSRWAQPWVRLFSCCNH